MIATQIPLAEPAALTDHRPAGRIQTSRDAFKRIDESGARRTEQKRVCDFIAQRGEYGATSHEIGAALHLGPQSVSARCNDLYRAGLIWRKGDRRTPEGGTCSAFVWRFRSK